MPLKLYDEWVTIVENKRINEKYYKLIFRSNRLSKNVHPGQFLHIQIQPFETFFLRRPFSYFRVRGSRIEVLYEILGRGTAMLSEKKKGNSLKVMGPLGKPFTGKLGEKKRILVAGGVGVPPLIYLAEKSAADYILIGTKSKKEVLPRKELRKAKGKILYSTNDGSYGLKGYVTLMLNELLAKLNPEKVFVQTCGPNVMMREVIRICRERGVSGEASLDEDMACGVGACLGCMVKTSSGWIPSCTEGPVFNFDAIEKL